MYDPKRLRTLIERVGPPAQSLADIPLQYWEPKTNPFPHADRDCKYLRTKTPVAASYTLRGMGSEGWCCHECGLDPPDADLARLLMLFEAIEGLCDKVVVLRTSSVVDDPAARVHQAYRHVASAMSLAWHAYSTVLGDYAQKVADSCARELGEYRRVWGQNTFTKADRDWRRVATSADRIIYSETEENFSDLDWMILERGDPRRVNTLEAELLVPTSLVLANRHLDLVDLGAAAPPMGTGRSPDMRPAGRRSGSSSGSNRSPRRRHPA